MNKRVIRAFAVSCSLVLFFALLAGCRQGILPTTRVYPPSEKITKTFPAPAFSPPGTTDKVAAGQIIFTTWCDGCHPGGEAGLGPSLIDIAARKTDAEITNTIRNGWGIMPSFTSSQLSDTELENIMAFLKTLK